jgi:hypothetical protein
VVVDDDKNQCTVCWNRTQEAVNITNMHEGNNTTIHDTINVEVIKIYDEKSLTAMTKSELIILCQNMGVFKHNGTKATKSKLIPEILEWQCNSERKIIVSRAGNLDSKVFSNNRDRLDYCLDMLLSAGVPMVSDKQDSLHYIHSHLISNHMNTNAAMATFVMEFVLLLPVRLACRKG